MIMEIHQVVGDMEAKGEGKELGQVSAAGGGRRLCRGLLGGGRCHCFWLYGPRGRRW